MNENVETLVFVYGTLRRGESNEHLLAGAAPRGLAQTEPRYTLASLGPFPALLRGGATSVTGEIYAVDAETLARLDRLEGHPRFYRRSTIALAGGRGVAGYLMARAQVRGRIEAIIPTGDWCAWRRGCR